MPGYVLIIDALSNRRIHLRAQLDTAAYPVEMAETQTEGLARIRKESPDVVIIADDLPGLRLRQFCKLLRSNPQTQLITVVVAVQKENQSARISALSAGAYDVIDHTAEAIDLKARLRSFMRNKHCSEDAKMRASPEKVQGLAEAIPDFAPNILATFVSCSANAPIDETRRRFDSSTGIDARCLAADAARRNPEPETDVYVLIESRSGDETRETLGALLTHPVSRHSRILFVTDSNGHGTSPLDLGAHDQVSSDVTATELAIRIQRLARGKRTADNERKTTTELAQKAYVDALTGLNNRNAMEEYLIRTDRALAEQPRKVAIMIADVDCFKEINDNHGHAAGDLILAHIAQTLKSRLRAGDFIARYGGEEFLIVLPDVAAGQAKCVAQRLRNAVANTPKAIENGTHVRATISIGIAAAGRSDRQSTTDLRRAADTALYVAKRNGRNRIEFAYRETTIGTPAPKISAAQ